MLPEVIAQKIFSSQKDLILAALKNKTDVQEIAELLTSHIKEEDGKFEVEDYLFKSISSLLS